ncbi:MAG TPA: hypothetical protein VFI57_00830 [Pyrinomonadaceae bacterium]|nr:hypothetical protein [Pyrinomonadaceae bacterium]
MSLRYLFPKLAIDLCGRSERFVEPHLPRVVHAHREGAGVGRVSGRRSFRPGNDYDFATPIEEADAPVVVPLRTRCTQCHNTSLATLMTYSIHYIPPVPTTRILKPLDQERAFYVALHKEERDDFKSLIAAR